MAKAIAIIITATLNAVAAMDKRIIKREKDFCLLNAIRLAMMKEKFNGCYLQVLIVKLRRDMKYLFSSSSFLNLKSLNYSICEPKISTPSLFSLRLYHTLAMPVNVPMYSNAVVPCMPVISCCELGECHFIIAQK